jgi:hypothetical protein
MEHFLSTELLHPWDRSTRCAKVAAAITRKIIHHVDNPGTDLIPMVDTFLERHGCHRKQYLRYLPKTLHEQLEQVYQDPMFAYFGPVRIYEATRHSCQKHHLRGISDYYTCLLFHFEKDDFCMEVHIQLEIQTPATRIRKLLFQEKTFLQDSFMPQLLVAKEQVYDLFDRTNNLSTDLSNLGNFSDGFQLGSYRNGARTNVRFSLA